MSFVYALLDNKGVRYIGKSVNLRHRLSEHWRTRNKKDYPVYRWLRKQPGLWWTVLEFSIDKALLNELERKWIALFRPTGLLLNLTEGGEGTLGRTHSAETRRKIGQSKIGKSFGVGRKLSEAHRAKLRSRVVSEEARLNYSIAQKKRMQKPEERQKYLEHLEQYRKTRRKAIRCSNGQTYASIREEGRILGIPSPNIICVLKGRYKQAYGYTFSYVSETTEERLNHVKQRNYNPGSPA